MQRHKLHACPAGGYFSVKKSNQKSLGEAPETPYASVRPDRKAYSLPDLGLDDAYKVFILIRSLLGAKIKCAAGTLRAYLRRRTDDVYIVRIQPQLSVRGSWGTAPSVFWFLLHE